MSALKQASARLIALFRRNALDREFDEEAQSHLDLAVDDYVQRGMSEAEARRLARMKFARPPTTSGVSTVPLSDTATTREVASTTLAHRFGAVVVHTRYRPVASRSNVARPC